MLKKVSKKIDDIKKDPHQTFRDKNSNVQNEKYTDVISKTVHCRRKIIEIKGTAIETI